MGKYQLAALLAVLILLAVATIFVVLYAAVTVGKILAGIFLIVTIGILVGVNRKKS